MTQPHPIRFFLLLQLHPGYGLVVLLGVAAVSLWTVVLSPSEIDSGLGMVLFIQMFLASTGFVPRARKGHFDQLVVAHRGRAAIAASHWLVSVAPGIIVWTALAATAFLLGNPSARAALVGRRGGALLIVSTLAWSAGFALSRGAAGVAWIGALVALMARHVSLVPSSPSSGVVAMLRQVATILVCPFLLVGPAPAFPPAAVAWAAAIAAIVPVLVCRLAGRIDLPLREDS